MKIAAVIVAGGRGHRLGRSQPKQFAQLGSRPLIDYSIEKFASINLDFIIAVLVEDYQKYYQPHPAITHIARGGKTRLQSVYNGLKACPKETRVVLIHDAARPFFPAGRLKEALDNMGKMDVDGLAPALVSTDTLVEVDNGQIISFPDRHRIYHTQTPQIFIYEKIMSAYEKFRENLNDQPFTDDLSLAHSAGLRCGLIEGSQMNFKITTESDWVLAEQLLKSGGLDFT